MRKMKRSDVMDSPMRQVSMFDQMHLRLMAMLLLALSAFFVPTVGNAGDVFNGKQVYKNHCANCHGTSGSGEIGNAPDFARGEGLMQSDVSLMEEISRGKGTMPGYQGVLTDQEILDVISYIRILF